MGNFRKAIYGYTPFERQMKEIEKSRRGFDADGVAPTEKTEEQIAKEHERLPVCHQPEGGPCNYPSTIEEDHRCGISRTVDVDCPYKGPPAKLKFTVEKEKADEERRKPLIRPAPNFKV